MGYRRNQKTLKLTFDGELAGLEVKVRYATPEMMHHVITVAENAGTGSLEDQARRVLDLCEAFGKLLDSWNYEDENGHPIPPTAEALASEDVTFVMALTYGWLDAIAERAQQMMAADADEPSLGAMEVADLPMEVKQP